MKWNCNNCSREMISEKENRLCLECWWKELVEKTEITPEAIRSFMEKYWFTSFTFRRGDYFDIINIGAENLKSLSSYPHYPVGLTTEYYPRTKKNTKKDFFGKEIYSEYSAFLEKLFYFAEQEKIKRIRGNWRKEINDTLVSFKVADIIIEKKTPEEIEKEE